MSHLSPRETSTLGKAAKLALAATALTLTLVTQASAQIYSAENFAYPAGDPIAGQNGGTGFAGAYTGGSATVAAGSLSFGMLSTSANSANLFSGFGQLRRTLSAFPQADGTTAYLSFLVQPSATNSLAGIEFGNQGNTELFIGATNGNYVVEGLFNANTTSTAAAVTAGQTALLVLRLDFLQGNDRLSLFFNPTPGGTEPAVANAVKTDVDLLANANFFGLIGMDTASRVDEFRLGATFADVTPIPEPSTCVMALSGLGMLFAARRFRRTASV